MRDENSISSFDKIILLHVEHTFLINNSFRLDILKDSLDFS